jgi:tetratricopeptide (TPR) repeat protein
MNLLCATGLPGADELSLSENLRRLQALVAYARRATERDVADFRCNPTAWGCPANYSEPRFRIGVLVTYLKRDCRLHYNPARAADTTRCSPYFADQDARDVFINDLLSDRRCGTCASIPVIVVVVGRRLGYPLHLVTDGRHVWARWDDGRDRFNIEASTPAGFLEYDDEHYRSGGASVAPMSKADQRSGYYLRNLAPAELALFLSFRACVLTDNLRFEESLPAWAKCCALAPTEPHYPRVAYEALLDAMYKRKFGKVMPRGGPHRRARMDSHFDARKDLPAHLVAVATSIKGHWHEVRGETGNAWLAYKAACDLEPENADYHADRERFAQRIEAHRASAGQAANQFVKQNTPAFPVPTRRADARMGQPPGRAAVQRAMAEVWENRGLELERDGELAAAQAAFVQGMALAADGQPECYVYLYRVIRKDILAVPAGARPEIGADDPRSKMPPPLQARLWAMRARVLESMDRINEAVLAFGEASILVPDNPQYSVEMSRLAQSDARRQHRPQPCLPPVPFASAATTTIWGVPGLFELEQGKE